MSHNKTAAIFDLDGTLFTGHFWHGLVKHHRLHKMKEASIIAYVAFHLPCWAASKLRILSEETYKLKWGEDLASTLRGLNREQILKVFEWVVDNYVMNMLRPDIMSIVRRHIDDGHTTIVLSGSFADFLDILKTRLGIEYAVGTQIEFIDGIASGRIVQPLCFGKEKARLLKEFLDNMKFNLDLTSSFAYADSIIDLPVLEMVGSPVATYPDKKLLKLAHQKDWRILPANQ